MSSITDRAIGVMEAAPGHDYTARELCKSLGLESRGAGGSENIGLLDAHLSELALGGFLSTMRRGAGECVYRFVGAN